MVTTMQQIRPTDWNTLPSEAPDYSKMKGSQRILWWTEKKKHKDCENDKESWVLFAEMKPMCDICVWYFPESKQTCTHTDYVHTLVDPSQEGVNCLSFRDKETYRRKAVKSALFWFTLDLDNDLDSIYAPPLVCSACFQELVSGFPPDFQWSCAG